MAVVVHVSHGDFYSPVSEDSQLPRGGGLKEGRQEERVAGAVNLVGGHCDGQQVAVPHPTGVKDGLFPQGFRLGVWLEESLGIVTAVHDEELVLPEAIDIRVGVGEAGGGRGAHHQSLDAQMLAGLQDIHTSLVVHLCVVLLGMVGADKGGDMKDTLHAFCSGFHRLVAGEIALDVFDARVIRSVLGLRGDVEGNHTLAASLDKHFH